MHNALRKCCKSCAMGPDFEELNEVESPKHFMFACHASHELGQKLWGKLKSDPEVAAKVQVMTAKPLVVPG